MYKIDETNQLLTLQIPLHVTDLGNKVLLLLLFFYYYLFLLFFPTYQENNTKQHSKLHSSSKEIFSALCFPVWSCKAYSHTYLDTKNSESCIKFFWKQKGNQLWFCSVFLFHQFWWHLKSETWSYIFRHLDTVKNLHVFLHQGSDWENHMTALNQFWTL